MKKRILRIIASFCLIICIITLNFTGIFASASTVTYSTFADHYFSAIGTNVPKNQRNSCGFVALSMLLSFYNFYYNDDFVSEWFEDSSPISSGTGDYPASVPKLYLENNYIPKDDEGNVIDLDYINFLSDNINTYLHFFLIFLAATNNSSVGWEKFLDLYDESYDMNISEAKSLMEYYLYDCIGFTTEQVVVHISNEFVKFHFVCANPIFCVGAFIIIFFFY